MKTKLIAELCSNHQGDMNIARRMIDDAAALGCWAVKIQKRDLEILSEGLKLMPRRPENSFGPNYYEHRKALEFSIEQITELKKYAEDQELIFIASVFDVRSAEEMAALGVKWLKLPSQLYSVFHMCRTLFDLQKKHDFSAMASVGMHDEVEIEEWQYQYAFDVLFYCRSLYPGAAGDLNLAKMRTLKASLTGKQQLGYSSHDKDGCGIPFAVSLGAEYVERHFTLDKTWKGSDHATVSSDPEDMKKIIADIEYVEEILGSEYAPLTDAEKRVRKVYRGF